MVPSHRTLVNMHASTHRHVCICAGQQNCTCLVACVRARTCTHGCKLTNTKCTHLSMMMMLPLSFRYKRVLELPRPSVCPDLWEHPRLLWVLLYLWFPLIWWWQELWRCVCVNVCLYGCVCISLCMLTHVTVDFCAFVHKNMCSCVFIETPCLYALIDRL